MRGLRGDAEAQYKKDNYYRFISKVRDSREDVRDSTTGLRL